MENAVQNNYDEERALFNRNGLNIDCCTFDVGESPVKMSENVVAKDCLFRSRYPFWYCKNVEIKDTHFLESARAGLWYGENFKITGCTFDSPKNIRKVKHMELTDVSISGGVETLWDCEDVKLSNVTTRGDYFAMNSKSLEIENLNLTGKYSFDGCENLHIKNSRLVTKDAFWNCKNVVVEDSVVIGEYTAWNSENVTFINCTLESLQGFCYVNNLVMKNCKVINTTLAFEYSSVDLDITTRVDSIKNPLSGVIRCAGIGELIMEKDKVDVAKTKIY